jgi:hypothetical protein
MVTSALFEVEPSRLTGSRSITLEKCQASLVKDCFEYNFALAKIKWSAAAYSAIDDIVGITVHEHQNLEDLGSRTSGCVLYTLQLFYSL